MKSKVIFMVDLSYDQVFMMDCDRKYSTTQIRLILKPTTCIIYHI